MSDDRWDRHGGGYDPQRPMNPDHLDEVTDQADTEREDQG